MVKLSPFRALRYTSDEKTHDVSDYISPPYDVISPDQREALVKKSPQNIVQLELPEGQEGEKYLAAANLLKTWTTKKILGIDPKPSFYLLETTYKIDDPFAPNEKLKRYGVLSALQLETPGKGAVRPHEKTLPKAKEDRLNLVKAVQANISPIFGLFFDTERKWNNWISKITSRTPISIGNEKKNLDHRMWKVDDTKLIQEFQSIVQEKELYIADGHHRYEVGWAYREGRLKGDPSASLNAGWRNIMIYVCPMEEAGLLMLPTHRLVKSNLTFEQWRKHLESFFSLEPVGKPAAAVERLTSRKKEGRAIGWATGNGCFILNLKKDISLGRCLSHRPDALKELDVILLHDLALGEGPGMNILSDKQVTFTQDVEAMQTKANQDKNYVGFILASAGVKALSHVAQAGEVMPPKTTYFYPKVPTGFTLMSLNEELS